MTNSADPDQLASSTLFTETEYVVISKRRVKYSSYGVTIRNKWALPREKESSIMCKNMQI